MAINLYFAQKREGTMHCGDPEVLGLAAQWGFWAVLAFWRRRRCYLLATATVLGLLETLFELYNRREPRDVAMTDDGFDGVARLQDGDASRLLAHFGYDSGAPVSQGRFMIGVAFHHPKNRAVGSW